MGDAKSVVGWHATLADQARVEWSEAQGARRSEREAERLQQHERRIERSYEIGRMGLERLWVLAAHKGGRVIDTEPAWALDGRGAEVLFDGLTIGVTEDSGRVTLWLRALCPDCDEWTSVGQFGTLTGLGQLLAEEVPPTGCECYVSPGPLVITEVEPAPVVISPEGRALLDALAEWERSVFALLERRGDR